MWGEAGKSLKRNLSNGVVNWGPGGTPTLVDIQRIGILRQLRLLTKATATFTAGASLALHVATWLSPIDAVIAAAVTGGGSFGTTYLASLVQHTAGTPRNNEMQQTSHG